MRLHDLLARPGVHILLDRDADPLSTLPPSQLVSIHRLASSPGRGLIAVRPDGYVGFRCRAAEMDQMPAWLAILRAGVPQGPPRGDLRGRRLPSVTAAPAGTIQANTGVLPRWPLPARRQG
jgi:hypothetical protein